MLQEQYNTLEEIPAQWRHLYIKNGEVFVLRGVAQFKTPEDVATVQEALRKERNDHTVTKAALRGFETLGTLEEVTANLAKIPELEATRGQVDEAKIETIVTARVNQRTAQSDRALKNANDKIAELTTENTDLKSAAKQRKVHDALRSAATEAGVVTQAIEDILIIGERQFDVDETGAVVAAQGSTLAAGTLPLAWLTEAKTSKLHWFPPSTPAGARGNSGHSGAGNNPWTNENWNMTEQGKILKENRTLAEQLAKAAGTSIGGAKPAPKK